jgi:branched-chain amino acid transport system permease protein
LVLAFGLAAFSFLVVRRITTSSFGRIIHAIREDEYFAQAMGKNTRRDKIIVCATSSCLAAIAGAAYAHYVQFIDPTSFTATESILIISMVIVGGAASMAGAFAGALFIVLLPEVFRFAGLPGALGANLRQIIYGVLLIIVVTYRPQGLFGRSSLTKRASDNIITGVN